MLDRSKGIASVPGVTRIKNHVALYHQPSSLLPPPSYLLPPPTRPSLSVLRKFRRNVEPLYEIARPAIYMRSSYGARGRLKVRKCRPRVHRQIGEGRGRFARRAVFTGASLCSSLRSSLRRQLPFLAARIPRARTRAQEIRDAGVITFIVLSIAREVEEREPSRSHRGAIAEPSRSHRGGTKIQKAPRASSHDYATSVWKHLGRHNFR